jgi:Cu+-exporting ATPase
MAEGEKKPTATQVQDLVCKMTVDQNRTQFKLVHGGHDYFFCSRKCMHKFLRDPARYTGGTSA